MQPHDFHNQLDQPRILAALREAEHVTTGKIYIYVSHRAITDALPAAHRRFEKLGLSGIHQHRASVLIYLAPKTCKFAILGDKAIHEKCGDDYWTRLAAELSAGLKAGDLTAALLEAIASLRTTLAEHFPVQA